jgi:hypothetical protein
MMTRSLLLVFLGLVPVLCGGLACTSKSVAPSVPTAHGYTFSLHTSDTNLWLGTQGLSDSRPGSAELIVEVRDTQGHRVEGVPVAFRVDPSWVQSATLMPQNTLTHDGIAHAVFKPSTTGVVLVMAQVNGETQVTHITVEARNIGNNSGK